MRYLEIFLNKVLENLSNFFSNFSIYLFFSLHLQEIFSKRDTTSLPHSFGKGAKEEKIYQVKNSIFIAKWLWYKFMCL